MTPYRSLYFLAVVRARKCVANRTGTILDPPIKFFWENTFLTGISEILCCVLEIAIYSGKLILDLKRLGNTPETPYSLERAYLGFSNVYLGLC